MLNLTNHSGGAKGADSAWDEVGKEFGMLNNKHYYAEGQRTPKGNTPITKADLLKADPTLVKVNLHLKRNFPSKSEYVNNLLRRNYYQVINSDAIFAVAQLDLVKSIVAGGTAWAVHMGILLGKPVFVFNQLDNMWYTWKNEVFAPIGVPTLTTNFAGIGTRELQENGKIAIRDVYTKTAVRSIYQQIKNENTIS